MLSGGVEDRGGHGCRSPRGIDVDIEVTKNWFALPGFVFFFLGFLSCHGDAVC